MNPPSDAPSGAVCLNSKAITDARRLPWRLHRGDYPRVGLELAVIREGAFGTPPDLLQQSQPRVQPDLSVRRQPHLVVHAALFEPEPRSAREPRDEETERDGIGGFGLDLHPLILGLIDPEFAAELGQHFGLRV